MASASTKIATTILKPVTTFEGHEGRITSISYFLDGQRIISGSLDKTTRQWDLKAGKEIEGAKEVFEKRVCAVAVSRDGRWIVTADGDWNGGRLKACEVETGIVKIFEGHSQYINTVDISTDSTLLASGSEDETSRIWNLKTGKLVAGPFKSVGPVGAVRFSSDSKKLAVELGYGTCLEVWDIQSQKLDIRLGKSDNGGTGCAPVFWTNENKNIVAAFEFNSESDSESDLDDVTSSTDSDRYYSSVAKTIYEFDASTLETIGAPFQGHTDIIWGLALSFDGALLASSSYHDYTIKLWAFESRQLLASFHVHNPITLILSSDSRQLVYTIDTEDDRNICICDIPPEILAQARITPRKKSARRDLLNSDATRRRPAGHHRPPISAIPITPRPSSTRDPQQPTFLRLRGFFASLLARTQSLFVTSNLVIPWMSVSFSCLFYS
ncbi:quinon protein alcohol dehydrogenase-like superfamily [Suillus spraguei]|nr:quinon protein alcohol dehydrogenase-like superfamily [Suillus spraguei]